MAVFHPQCIKDRTEIITLFDTHTFKTSGTIIRKPGWRSIYLGADYKPNPKEDSDLLPDVAENDPVKNADCKMEEKQTKAPPLHTESSILASMETAGKNIEDEDLKEAMKDCGLGTPATRAQILERLIHVKYITREKNKLIPTEKGIALIGYIIDKELLSPELTGEWEKKLNDMAKAKYNRETYMDGIEVFAKKIIENLKNTEIKIQYPSDKVLGNCPVCDNGQIIESKMAYGCDQWKSNNCKFAIWKTIAKKNITKNMAKTLLDKKKTDVLKGFTSKAGKTFETRLALKEGKVVFDFS